MQEEVTQKTIALYVKVGKGAARLTEQALQKAIQKFLEQKSKPAHGKQTMLTLGCLGLVQPKRRLYRPQDSPGRQLCGGDHNVE